MIKDLQHSRATCCDLQNRATSSQFRGGPVSVGFVRTAVWDRLHKYPCRTPLDDIDVLYFDARNPDRKKEKTLEATLSRQLARRAWSVRNQARMHVRNNDRPYRNTEDAISFWLETPTCVAVWLDESDQLHIIAPYGLADLFNMRCTMTPAGKRRPKEYAERLRKKIGQRNGHKFRLKLRPRRPRVATSMV